MSDMVFIVRYDSGSWDSHIHGIAGIFDTPELAEKLKNELNAKAEKIKLAAPPKPDEDSHDMLAEEKYSDYCAMYSDWMGWNGASVISCQMNTIVASDFFPFPEPQLSDASPSV